MLSKCECYTNARYKPWVTPLFMPLNLSLSLSHTLLTSGHFVFVLHTHTHTVSNETHTHTRSSSAGSVSSFCCRMQAKSLPMPCGCPCAHTTQRPCPGASGQEGRPPTPLGGSAGGIPPQSPRSGRSLALLCRPVPQQIAQQKAVAAKETGACLIIAAKPFLRRRLHLPTCAIVCRSLNTEKRFTIRARWRKM